MTDEGGATPDSGFVPADSNRVRGSPAIGAEAVVTFKHGKNGERATIRGTLRTVGLTDTEDYSFAIEVEGRENADGMIIGDTAIAIVGDDPDTTMTAPMIRDQSVGARPLGEDSIVWDAATYDDRSDEEITDSDAPAAQDWEFGGASSARSPQ